MRFEDWLNTLLAPAAPRCPTCGLAFHGQPECRRCKTDLSPLHACAEEAWTARRTATQLLFGGRFREAAAEAARAQGLHSTPRGEILWRLAALAEKGEVLPD